MIVYVDKTYKAHWAYLLSFFVPSQEKRVPERPTYIIDANNFTIYKHWNDLKTLDAVKAGGLGGNHKLGRKIFDGSLGHLSALDLRRDAKKKICYMQNEKFDIKDDRQNGEPMTFACEAKDAKHNNVFWNGHHDQVETTWSPSNDVAFGSQVTIDMFKTWYSLPVLTKNGKPRVLSITVHDPVENAYWDGEAKNFVFGDSVDSNRFNPFTQLDTIAHELAHAFTDQHSDLEYADQSGGINESFSDMAGMAAEFFVYGQTKFLVGVGDVKAEGKALRYMDKPSKDCKGKDRPGYDCSIDHVSQYPTDIPVNPHNSSGIFNRVYYLLANTPDWNAKKAFDVMVKANVDYWTATSNFADAACGVLNATSDFEYDTKAVINAFAEVGVKVGTEFCKK